MITFLGQLIEGWRLDMPRSSLAAQWISLLLVMASTMLVVAKRKNLPYPRLWGGVLIALCMSITRRAVAIGFILTNEKLWLDLYNILLVVVPATFFVVAWVALSGVESQRRKVNDLEERYRTALAQLEERLNDSRA